MQRVWVVGNSGSGKTTVAAAVASHLGAPQVELDSIYHQPGWVALAEEEFRARVEAVAGADTWVVDGNYLAVADLVAARADAVVWLDLPRGVVMRRLARRTLWRGLRRVELWNGNRESLTNFFRRDPERSILVWAWTRHQVYRSRYEEAASGPEWARLEVVRLRTPGEVETFLAGFGDRPH